jgi:hypothetical protein
MRLEHPPMGLENNGLRCMESSEIGGATGSLIEIDAKHGLRLGEKRARLFKKSGASASQIDAFATNFVH